MKWVRDGAVTLQCRRSRSATPRRTLMTCATRVHVELTELKEEEQASRKEKERSSLRG